MRNEFNLRNSICEHLHKGNQISIVKYNSGCVDMEYILYYRKGWVHVRMRETPTVLHMPYDRNKYNCTPAAFFERYGYIFFAEGVRIQIEIWKNPFFKWLSRFFK